MSSGKGEWKMNASEFSSFLSFLMQPMINLEPGSSGSPTDFENEQQNMPQDLGKWKNSNLNLFSLLRQTMPSFARLPTKKRL